jgi:hypothetical protein
VKLSTSAFESDRLTLSWRDLFALALGQTLRTGALNVSRGRQAGNSPFSDETLAALDRTKKASDRLSATIKEYS